MGISSALLLMVGFLFVFGGSERGRAIQQSRDPGRISCAQTGLQLAKTFFQANYTNWNECKSPALGNCTSGQYGFLTDPSVYNPVKATWMATGYTVTRTKTGAVDSCKAPCLVANPVAPAGSAGTCAAIPLCVTHPELFFDLDGDGKPDVYIYIRDNMDEKGVQATQDWLFDSDQNVIVGAVCISRTLAPRGADGNIDPSRISVEALLSYDSAAGAGGGYDMHTHGATGTGNIN